MRHFIIVKFNDEIDKEKEVEPIRNLFNESLEFEGVNKVDIHLSNSDLPNRFDLMIEMELTPDGLKIYNDSEMHKNWKSKYGEYIVSKTIFDCE